MNSDKHTTCNPVDLEYRFREHQEGTPAHREAADPSVVRYHDKIWLFASKSGGYWHSDNFRDWTFVPDNTLPHEDYAPDVRVINDWLYFTASRRGEDCPVYRTQNPEAGDWELVGKHMAYWDPNQFQDDDGRVYLYYGCSNEDPLYGREMDPETMAPKSEEVALIPNHQQERHGWERCGPGNSGMESPWLEGAWMTKHEGRYYLQYAAPGTEFDVYADGVYVSDEPLGSYEYAQHNPFSFKPGGYIGGSGHGSTFQGRHGNWWHAATMCISVHQKFERRVGIWPAGFDEDGVLYCNTRFGDYPMRLPRDEWDPWTDPFSGWMLLSYSKPVTASSALSDHPPEYAVDESVRTWWASESVGSEQWIEVDLEDFTEIHAIQVNFAQEQCDQYLREGPPLRHQYLLEASTDRSSWCVLADRRESTEDAPHDYLELDTPEEARYVRLTITHIPGGGHPAISGLRVFGHGPGESPAAPAELEIIRNPDDPCCADLRWTDVPEANGYNVLGGIAPDKLYSTWMVRDANELTMRCLTAGQDYCFAVESFNSAGVSTTRAADRPN